MPKRITVKVSEELHRDVRVKAAWLGQPVSEIVRTLLRKWTREEEEGNAKDAN